LNPLRRPIGLGVMRKKSRKLSDLGPFAHRRARMLTGAPAPKCTTGSHSRPGAARAGLPSERLLEGFTKTDLSKISLDEEHSARQ
jgi:hypothetical protein